MYCVLQQDTLSSTKYWFNPGTSDIYLGKQCRSWWNAALYSISSGSSLFEGSAVAQWLSACFESERPRVRASPASLCCGPWARHIYPSLVLVQPRKTRPCLTERFLMGRKKSNQTNKSPLFAEGHIYWYPDLTTDFYQREATIGWHVQILNQDLLPQYWCRSTNGQIKSHTWDFQQCGMCDQQKLRPACAYAQSDQSLC